MQIAVVPSSLGQVLVAATKKGIRAVFLGDNKATLMADFHKRFPGTIPEQGCRAFDETVKRVKNCVERPGLAHHLPLDILGTPFQKKVWAALRDIKAGSTVSYSDLAHKIGKPDSVRALANACGANPVAVLIPCHRVIRTDGKLSGYRWGIRIKKELLKREKRPVHDPLRAAA